MIYITYTVITAEDYMDGNEPKMQIRLQQAAGFFETEAEFDNFVYVTNNPRITIKFNSAQPVHFPRLRKPKKVKL